MGQGHPFEQTDSCWRELSLFPSVRACVPLPLCSVHRLFSSHPPAFATWVWASVFVFGFLSLILARYPPNSVRACVPLPLCTVRTLFSSHPPAFARQFTRAEVHIRIIKDDIHIRPVLISFSSIGLYPHLKRRKNIKKITFKKVLQWQHVYIFRLCTTFYRHKTEHTFWYRQCNRGTISLQFFSQGIISPSSPRIQV